MSMDVEVSVAWNFVISHLYSKLPRRRVDCFGQELEKGLKLKFQGHWYPDTPFKGSAFRCVKVSGVAADPVVERACISSGLCVEEVREYLPNELTLWIDPKEVSYRIGEKGQVKILYSQKKVDFPCEVAADCEVQSMSNREESFFNPDAQSFRPINSLSASLSNLNVSPADGSSPTSPWTTPSPTHQLHSSGNSPINSYPSYLPTMQRQTQQEPKFTAAMFAQTKFGSTKLKTNAKRPNRLSPTDMTGYMKPRALMHSHWINGVGAVSPVGPSGINAINGLPAPGLGYSAQLQQPLGVPRGRQSLSPHDVRQEYLTQQQQQQMLLLQQQHQLQMQQQQQQQQQQRFLQQQQQMQQAPARQPTPHNVPNALRMSASPPIAPTTTEDEPLSDLLHTPFDSCGGLFDYSSAASSHHHSMPAVFHNNNNHDAFGGFVEGTGPGEKSPSSDLGLEGIMACLARAQEEEDVNSDDVDSFGGWGENLPSPYASLKHILLAN